MKHLSFLVALAAFSPAIAPAQPHPVTIPLEKETRPYLGVEVAPVPPALNAQLGLDKGVGLVVETVFPDSPAAKAGLQQYDILTKLNDQILIEPGQFATLVRNQKENAEITLTVVRKGATITVTATLVAKELPALLGPHHKGPMRKFILRNEGPFQAPVPPPAPGATNSGGEPAPIRVPDSGPHPAAKRISKADADGVFEMKEANGQREIKFIDKAGNVVFEGTVNTPAERESLPAKIKQKYEEASSQDLKPLDDMIRWMLPEDEPGGAI